LNSRSSMTQESKKQLIQSGIDFGDSLLAIIYPINDGIRDVVDVYREKSIKMSDRIDYIVAVYSVTILGSTDVFNVGEFSLESTNKWGAEEINKFLKQVPDRVTKMLTKIIYRKMLSC